MSQQDLETLTDKVAELIINAKRIIAFTGAGVSTESGIPDFRSPGGLWDRFDPDDFTYQRFISRIDSRRKQWQLLWKDRLAREAKPNPAHYAIVELDRLGKLDCVITQNVDNLQQKAGLPDDKVFELHGNMQRVICLSCGRHYPLEQIKVRLDKGEEVPDCEACHGILKPTIVLFGEPMLEEVLHEATIRASNCDLFIVVGSSLVVYPAAMMPVYAADAGAKLVIINLSPTPMDEQTAVLVRAKAGEAMAKIARKVAEKIGG